MTTKTREGTGLWEQCSQCKLVINRLGVPKDKLKNFYNQQYQYDNSFKSGKIVSPKEHYKLAMHSMKPVADVIKPYLNKNMRVLDIGAATGELLSCIKEDVAYCFGIELNEEYCNFINDELGIDTSNQDYFEINFDKPFDLIIINSTLDHMYNSLGVLQKIYDDLIPESLLYIQTPNHEQALKNYVPEEQRFEFQKVIVKEAHIFHFHHQHCRWLLNERDLQ